MNIWLILTNEKLKREKFERKSIIIDARCRSKKKKKKPEVLNQMWIYGQDRCIWFEQTLGHSS